MKLSVTSFNHISYVLFFAIKMELVFQTVSVSFVNKILNSGLVKNRINPRTRFSFLASLTSHLIRR